MAKDIYLGNPLLKAVNVKMEYTPEQAEEYIKCANDPQYFIEKYVKIVSLDEGLVPFQMYDFQKKIVKSFHENRFTICKIPRQSGKCVCINTPIVVRNKKTGEVQTTTIGALYESTKASQNQAM